MKFLSFIALLSTAGLSLFAQNKPVAIIPFELKSDSRIYIKCSVNNSDTLTFLFDTGAGATVVNQSIIGKKVKLNLDSETTNQGANGQNKVKTSSGNTLSFGGIKATGETFLAIPYGDASFDGVFGYNLMKDYLIEINYRKKLLYFYASKSYVYDNTDYDRFEVDYTLGVPTIKAVLIIDNKNAAGDFELDTGGDSGLILTETFLTKHNLAQRLKKVASATMTGSDGIATATPIVIIPEIVIDQKYFYRFPALLSNSAAGALANPKLAGILGNLFLKRFDIILDLAHHQIFLKPNDLLYTPYYDFLIK